jgi:hypothetical protein
MGKTKIKLTMSTIKPYKESKCKSCSEMKIPDDSIKRTMSGQCFEKPHFHYQKVQQAKYAAKQQVKPAGTLKTSKIAKPRQTDLNKRSLSSLLLLAQDTFNKFIRLRDSKGDHFKCISCNRFKSLDQMNAGHYYSAGNHSYLRFNENNVHSQCVKCNNYLSGNLIPYRENLIKKIGADELEKLDTWKNFSFKWDKIQLIALIQLYREKIKKFG